MRTHSADGEIALPKVTPAVVADLRNLYAAPARDGSTGEVRVFLNHRIPKARTCIYAIRRRDTMEIKIGVSRDVQFRLAALQTAHGEPLELAVWFKGSPRDEVMLHEAFGQYRKLGEWFNESPEITDWVSRQRLHNLTERGFE